jgi:hypothetical protein
MTDNITASHTEIPTVPDRPDVARRRAQWKKYQGRLDPARLVFIDETWAKTNMTRSHGRCACGKRLIAKVPHGRWRTLTFLAALRRDRIDAPCVIDGPINGRSFLAYVEQILVPALKPGDIVIIDNLGRARPSVAPSALQVPSSSSCRPIRPTSTRSSSSSPSSKPLAQGRRANRRGHLEKNRRAPRRLLSQGMRKLHRKRRIRFSVNHQALDVERQQVVLGESEAADWRFGF